jgi:hypothetical protein
LKFSQNFNNQKWVPKIVFFNEKQAHITCEAKPRGLHFVRFVLLLQIVLLVAIGTFDAIGTFVAIGTFDAIETVLPFKLSYHWILVAIGTLVAMGTLVAIRTMLPLKLYCH